MEPRWLSAEEDRAWRAWLAMSELLRSQIARDLQGECGISEPDFAVLVHLSEAPAGRLRMTELAAALRWSKSRLSHQLTRMEARGQVRREGCPGDARSAFAVLTESGRREIERAAPLHVAGVRRHLIDLLEPEQLQALERIASVVVEHLLSVDAAWDAAEPCGAPPCPSAGQPPA